LTRFLHGLLVCAAAGEIAVVAAAVLIRLRQAGLTLAEAGAYGLMGPLMLLSLAVQAAALAGCPGAALIFEAALLILAAADLLRQRRHLGWIMASVAAFGRLNPLLFGGLLGTAAVLLMLLVTLPPLNGATGLPAWSPPSASAFLADPGPANHRVLVDLFERLSAGSGLLGLISYLIIALATYALARRYAWPPTAATVTLVVLSQPRLFYQALSSGAEILPAAAGLFCLLALYRAVERPRFADLALLLVGLGFTVSDQPLGTAFAVVLGLLSIVVLYRRHGGRFWWWLARQRPLGSLAALAAALVFSQAWRRVPGGAGTAAAHLPPNAEGILGAGANALRYMIQSMDLMPAGEQLGRWIFASSPRQGLEGLYRAIVEPLVGQSGAAAPFGLIWGFDPRTAGFGPLGFALVLPAVAYALVRGPRRLKAVATALLGFAYLACLIPAWTPENGVLFTRFFACAGFTVAFLLPPWRLRRRSKLGLQLFCLLLLCHAALGHWWG
jgi:hypothetical protein